jgi:hypothetical protein
MQFKNDVHNTVYGNTSHYIGYEYMNTLINM